MKKHIIAVSVVKGGTGKTTTAGAIAEEAQRDGRKTLAIDLDPQGSLSFWYRASIEPVTTADVLRGTDPRKAIVETPAGFGIIPASGSLSDAVISTGSSLRLEKALETLRKSFDFIVIDCPPGIGDLMYNGLLASNEVLLPLAASITSIHGLLTSLDIIRQVKQKKKNLKVIGTLITEYDHRPNVKKDLQSMIEETAEKNRVPYLGAIRQCVKVEEAQACAEPLYSYAPRCTAAQDYKEVYNKITEKD